MIRTNAAVRLALLPMIFLIITLMGVVVESAFADGSDFKDPEFWGLTPGGAMVS